MSSWILVVVIVLGLLASGVFSGSETGLYSISRSRLDNSSATDRALRSIGSRGSTRTTCSKRAAAVCSPEFDQPIATDHNRGHSSNANARAASHRVKDD